MGRASSGAVNIHIGDRGESKKDRGESKSDRGESKTEKTRIESHGENRTRIETRIESNMVQSSENRENRTRIENTTGVN